MPEIIAEKRKRVLFVCEANLNRSQTAKWLAEAMIFSNPDFTGISVESAGLKVRGSGRNMHPDLWALLVPRMRGFKNYPGHAPEPKQATSELVEKFSHVLCFEDSQIEPLRKAGAKKVFTIHEYAGGNQIADPNKCFKDNFFINHLPWLVVDRLGVAGSDNGDHRQKIFYRMIREIDPLVYRTLVRIVSDN